VSPGALIRGADRALIGRDLGAFTPSAPNVLGGIRALVDGLVLGLTNSCDPSKFLHCHSFSESSIARQVLSDNLPFNNAVQCASREWWSDPSRLYATGRGAVRVTLCHTTIASSPCAHPHTIRIHRVYPSRKTSGPPCSGRLTMQSWRRRERNIADPPILSSSAENGSATAMQGRF